MMMSEQHPFDGPNANFTQVVEDRSVPQIDQQCGITVTDNINVAGVGPLENIGQDLLKTWHRIYPLSWKALKSSCVPIHQADYRSHSFDDHEGPINHAVRSQPQPVHIT